MFKVIFILIQKKFKPFIVLSLHFFNRLFRNDIVDFEDQMRAKIIGVLAILAAISGHLAIGFVYKYQWIRDTGTSWIEKCAFITFCMLVMGFLAVLEWDIMFPDARDYVNLIPLPIRARTLLAAKFASLCLFMGLFALSMNFLPTIVFPIFLLSWQTPSLLYTLGFALVHMITILLACFFAFFFNVLLISILMTFLGYKLFNRISAYIRSFFLIAHVFLFLLYLRGALYGFGTLKLMQNLKANHSALQNFYNFFPPLWFTDFYETLIGNPNLPFHGTLNYALLGLLIMGGVFYLTFGLSYRRHLKKMGSVQKKIILLKKLRMFLSKIFNRVFFRNPVQRAVFHFYGKTLRASMFHKMRLALFIAIGVGLIPFQIAINEVIPQNLTGINRIMISIPLILSFFLLLGLRAIVNMPISLEANWIFRLTERKNARHYFTALRKGIFFLNLLPLFVVLFIVYAFLWDGMTAFYHCLYGLVVSVLLMEVLFLHNCKIPFACSYLPGQEKIQLFWLFYLFLFLAYINLMSWIELELLRAPSIFFVFYAIAFFIILGIRIYQTFFFYKKITIQFEEEPVPVLIGLDYKAPSYKRGAI